MDVRVRVWTHVNVCEGPYHHLRFGRRGCCFYKSENTESDWYTASPTGWLISNFLIVLTGDIIFLSQCQLLRCASTSRTLMHPNLAHLLLTINQQQGRESNKLAFCSSLTTSTLVPNSITTDSYFLTLNGPASNTYAKVTQGTVTNSLYTHYNEITTNHSQMDVLPAHLNRDSFRDSLKGLVALEIILINPFGFPINKIISQPAFVENPGTPCIRSSM